MSARASLAIASWIRDVEKIGIGRGAKEYPKTSAPFSRSQKLSHAPLKPV